jgi:hypothetical protein
MEGSCQLRQQQLPARMITAVVPGTIGSGDDKNNSNPWV